MDIKFFDSFRYCSDAFLKINELTFFSLPGRGPVARRASEQLEYVVEQLSAENIHDDIINIVACEPHGFSIILRYMNPRDRKIIFFNVFDQVTDQIDALQDKPLSTFGEIRLTTLQRVLTGLLEAFGRDFPEKTLVNMGGESFTFYNWHVILEEMSQKWGQ